MFSYHLEQGVSGLHILSKAVCLWPTEGEWNCMFCKRQPHHMFSYHQQGLVSGLHILWKAVCLWPTEGEWNCTFCKRQPHQYFPATNREWVAYTFCERQSHHIFSHDQQYVSGIANFVKGSLMTFHFIFLMKNREWVVLHMWKAVSSHLFLWPTGSEWQYTFCSRKSHIISSYE